MFVVTATTVLVLDPDLGLCAKKQLLQEQK